MGLLAGWLRLAWLRYSRPYEASPVASVATDLLSLAASDLGFFGWPLRHGTILSISALRTRHPLSIGVIDASVEQNTMLLALRFK